MKKNYLSFAGIALIFGLFLFSCTLPTPTCATESLLAVTLTDPPMWGIVGSLTPTLNWTYPVTSCNPEGYAIKLMTGPFFTDTLGGGTGDPSTSWAPGSPLEPGKEYAWNVSPINGTTLGPIAGRNYFFTGPICETAALVAPNLLEPADGGTFNYLYDDGLIWDYPENCIPEGYRVDLSIDPTFADTSLSGGTGNPSTRWGPGSPLAECVVYYWRVAPINGTTLGPPSLSRSFTADTTGACGGSPVSPPDSASLSGIVWHDLCAIPELGPLPDPLPEGCIDTGGGGIGANGIREAGEPGIAGVQVDLHLGLCADPVVASLLTDANGAYSFDGILAFGDHCLSVDALAAPNDSVLIPGGWTAPLPGVNPATHSRLIASGDAVIDLDFGWDYQFLPAYVAPTPEPSSFKFDKNAFCRKGPNKAYTDITAIPVGEIVPVIGRNNDNSWLYVSWRNTNCWVSSITGQFFGEYAIIPLLTPIPLPDSIPPTITNIRALEAMVYYVRNSCGPTKASIGARISDDSGIADAYVRYRYSGNNGPGNWRTAPTHDQAMGGQYGFIIDVGSEAAQDLGKSGGVLEYQVYATDNNSNTTAAPDGNLLGVPVSYCP